MALRAFDFCAWKKSTFSLPCCYYCCLFDKEIVGKASADLTFRSMWGSVEVYLRLQSIFIMVVYYMYRAICNLENMFWILLTPSK